MKFVPAFGRALAVGLATAVLLAACGGSSDGDQSPRVAYGKVIAFGDSLTDVGTYAVSGVAALGGGRYTINSGLGGEIWVERLAAQLGVSAPCPAQTGLNAIEAAIGFPPVPVVEAPECFDYAQGGARVTNPIGPANAALFPADPSGALGQLTDPVINQIQRHLVKGEGFAADDLVLVLAGANDVFMNLATVGSTGPEAAVVAMGTAGAELAAYIKTLIVANGATRVVVVNMPDVSITPFGYSLEASAPGTQALINAMVTTFNGQLTSGLAGTPEVLVVDAYTEGRSQAANPAQYSLTNVSTPACDAALAVLGSLSCTANTLISSANAGYLYADAVHPTPYGHQLLAQYVALNMARIGWL